MTIHKHHEADMIHNGLTPHRKVDPEMYGVRADGELLACDSATVQSMTQHYFLF
jgi:urease subunit alpha